MTRPLPPSASVAHASEGAKLHAPAAARNAQALTDLLVEHAPQTGQALEIASGTGQHIVAFAKALPGLTWQPSEVNADRRASIDAYAAQGGLTTTVATAIPLDATRQGWAEQHRDQDLIVLVNLLHLISTDAVQTLIHEAAKALADHGTLILYGPFKRAGALTSEGDARFDAELRGADPAIGYKDDLEMTRWLADVGLELSEVVQMPANNLAFIARKPAA